MRLSHGLQFSTGAEHLQSILADRFQHEQAWSLWVLFGSGEQVFVQQGGDLVQYRFALTAKLSIHLLDCLQGSTPHEDREHTEQPLFLDRQEGIRPGQGVAQGVLASGQIPRSSGQNGQAMREALRECRQRQELEAGGGQLKRQGQPIQAPADLRNQRGSAGVKLHGGLNLVCPLEEERYGSIVGERLLVWKACWIGQGQRLDDQLAFAPHPQRLPARHQDFELRTGSQQLEQEWRRLHHLFEVVQDEQQVLVLQCCFQVLEWRAGATALEAKGLHDSRKDQPGIGNGSQRDETDSIEEDIPHLCCHLERQARLAHAAGAGERQQTHLGTGKQGTGGSQLALPPDERGERQGQAGQTPVLVG